MANLLNRFLGMYVQNFDPKQLNVGIWSGDVTLRNLELRKEALAFVTKRLQSHEPVSEYDVQQQIVHGLTMRGLVGPLRVGGRQWWRPFGGLFGGHGRILRRLPPGRGRTGRRW